MEEKRDYSLLRPFDLEAFKAGEKALFIKGADVPEVRAYVAGPDKDGRICIADEYGSYQIVSCAIEAYCMAPLAWVRKSADEDALWPVYKGDVLYCEGTAQTVLGTKTDADGDTFLTFTDSHFDAWLSGPWGDCGSTLTWTPPKKKREGWIAIKTIGNPINYISWCSHICSTKEQAENEFGASSVIVVPIEWEEPDGQEGGAK